jgi:hypothetical protein
MSFGVSGLMGNVEILSPLADLSQNGALQIVQMPSGDGEDQGVRQFYRI